MSNLQFLILGAAFVCAHSYNILGLFPHPGKSHVEVFLPLMKGLAAKGHNVTVMSYYNLYKPIPNYTEVSLVGQVNLITEVVSVGEHSSKGRLSKYAEPMILQYIANMSCESSLSLPRVQQFIKQKQQFDVMIAEFFNSDCYLGYHLKTKIPLIGISSSTVMPWTYKRFGSPNHPAYMPNNLMDYSDRLSFIERLENTVVSLLHQFYFDIFMSGNDQHLITKYFGKLPPLDQAVYNSSLLLVNTHFSLNLPRPLVPNIIEIGGIHIKEPKRLPKVNPFTGIYNL